MNNDTRPDSAFKDRDLFDQIAAKYLKKDLVPSSRRARKMRLFQTLRHCPQMPELDMLEVGCGTGFAADYLAGAYRSYTGLDYSQELIRYARARHTRPNVTFQAIDFYQFSPAQSYDSIFLIGVLHHMTDIPAAVNKCASLLKPGGCLVVNEPQSVNILFHALRKIRAKIDQAYSDEQEELTECQLTSLFRQAGLVQVSSAPQGFLSTPFAEVVIPPQVVSTLLSRLACSLDAILEDLPYGFLKKISWNIIVKGEKSGL
jgi:2-polyprenyl-3-methyl-5-hydroxy-6-metoxy-1,4-benzoquinol methylase